MRRGFRHGGHVVVARDDGHRKRSDRQHQQVERQAFLAREARDVLSGLGERGDGRQDLPRPWVFEHQQGHGRR